MKMKVTIISVTITSIITIFIILVSSCMNLAPQATTEKEQATATEAIETEATTTQVIETTSTDTHADKIRVTKPVADQLVQSPLIIEGEARGTWFFEASFPVKLLDSNRNVIAEYYATAQGEWMTEDFVPFRSELEFKKPDTATGILVLEKDNPSGLPENDDSIEIPVRFE